MSGRPLHAHRTQQAYPRTPFARPHAASRTAAHPFEGLVGGGASWSAGGAASQSSMAVLPAMGSHLQSGNTSQCASTDFPGVGSAHSADSSWLCRHHDNHKRTTKQVERHAWRRQALPPNQRVEVITPRQHGSDFSLNRAVANARMSAITSKAVRSRNLGGWAALPLHLLFSTERVGASFVRSCWLARLAWRLPRTVFRTKPHRLDRDLDAAPASWLPLAVARFEVAALRVRWSGRAPATLTGVLRMLVWRLRFVAGVARGRVRVRARAPPAPAPEPPPPPMPAPPLVLVAAAGVAAVDGSACLAIVPAGLHTRVVQSPDGPVSTISTSTLQLRKLFPYLSRACSTTE